MKQLTLVIFAMLAISSTLTGQRQETVFGRDGLHFSGIWGAFTNTYSFYDEDRGYHSGGTVGLEFGRTIFLGYAWGKLRDDIALPGGTSSFRLRQKNVVLSVMPNAYQVIHPVLSFQAGSGRVTLSDGEDDRVFILQPSAGMELNVFKWFHVGVEGGYRFVTENDLDQVTKEELSAPFAQLNLRFGISWGRT
jgi:hypothetical protein